MTGTRLALGAAAATACALAACDHAPAAAGPSSPTWVDDIEPLLRGNCFHCHGAGPRPKGTERWDFYDVADCPDLGMVEGVQSASIWGTFIVAFLRAPDGMRMPPPPATRLDEQQIQMFERWWPDPTRGRRARNHVPTAKLVGAILRDGGDVALTLDVSDADREQVLGRLAVAGQDAAASGPHAPVLGTGRQRLRVAAAPGRPLAVTLCDGQDTVRVDLGMAP